jgi:hypothetical protein
LTITDEMVERAAKALHKRNGFFSDFERASPMAQQEYREDARAALEAALSDKENK